MMQLIKLYFLFFPLSLFSFVSFLSGRIFLCAPLFCPWRGLTVAWSVRGLGWRGARAAWNDGLLLGRSGFPSVSPRKITFTRSVHVQVQLQLSICLSKNNYIDLIIQTARIFIKIKNN